MAYPYDVSADDFFYCPYCDKFVCPYDVDDADLVPYCVDCQLPVPYEEVESDV